MTDVSVTRSSLTFHGAAQQVTGSCYLLQTDSHKVLLECGMPQGRDQVQDWHSFRFPFKPKDIDAVVLSHAHIDHSGLLPLLVNKGFRGKIVCTPGTAQILPILLKDSVSLYLRDLEWKNRKAARAGRREHKPVMALDDVDKITRLISPQPYQAQADVVPNVTVQLSEAGHILGSAIVQLWIEQGGETRKLVFSGDLGNPATVLMHDPYPIGRADVVLMESTYGDRDHKTVDNTVEELAEALAIANREGGNVFIPAFALGRTQEVLYYLALLHRQGRLPQQAVFVDSPMAISIVKVYRDYLDTLDKEDLAAIGYREGQSLQQLLPMLKFTESVDESMAINRIRHGAIVIAGSGMCNGGRIIHHFKHNLWKDSTHLIFVGYQATGTLGRRLVDGAKRVRIFGQEIAVKARIHTLGGLSAHAGQSELIKWVSRIEGQPQVYLVHGEGPAQQCLQGILAERGIQVAIAEPGQRIEV